MIRLCMQGIELLFGVHLFHRWGQWERVAPILNQVLDRDNVWQERTCSMCGKTQREGMEEGR